MVLDVAQRERLAARATEALLTDSRVLSVDPFGSLEGGKPDQFSDIDLAATLVPESIDRDFFFDLPEIMTAVGETVITGWGFTALPKTYVGTFNFVGFPLFWSVDVAVVSDTHVDGSDLISVHRWEQIYKMWIGAAKQVARARSKLDHIDRLLSKHLPPPPAVAGQSSGAVLDQLDSLLSRIGELKVMRGDPYEELQALCEELAASLMSGERA